ncbi:MAG: beta family protein [Rhodospirillaceae bacterium]|nr:beta family protein [Rhodospirillaceae bacterium]
MSTTHFAILKANQGELEALKHLDSNTARKITPLFEIGQITDAIRERKYMRTSKTPVMTYLSRALDAIGKVWVAKTAMIDGFNWAADATVESGQHAMAYLVQGLAARGVVVIPLVGYDRWGNDIYRLGIASIPAPIDGRYCLRLDSSAMEDAAEPDHFKEVISHIIETLALKPATCSVLLDFGDVSTPSAPIEKLVASASDVVKQLQRLGFQEYVVAGCSLPRSVDLAVDSHDSTDMVARKEMLTWQALRQSLSGIRILYGDYGVRGPTTTEIRSKYTNGKIRHTINKQTFVARGHAFYADHSNAQMQDLSTTVVQSPHFLGEKFSWGDAEIKRCSSFGAFGSLSSWIAIDTNHHLTFVVQEVEEFERNLTVRAREKVEGSPTSLVRQ